MVGILIFDYLTDQFNRMPGNMGRSHQNDRAAVFLEKVDIGRIGGGFPDSAGVG